MRAIVTARPGSGDEVELVDLPDPRPTAGQIHQLHRTVPLDDAAYAYRADGHRGRWSAHRLRPLSPPR